MTTSIRILRQEMKWTEGGTSGEEGGEEEEDRRGDGALLSVPRLRMRGLRVILWHCAQMQCCVPHLRSAENSPALRGVCVCLCPVHLTSLNSNNVFPPINMLWITEYIIDPPAQPYCYPSSTPFTAFSLHLLPPSLFPLLLHHWGLQHLSLNKLKYSTTI